MRLLRSRRGTALLFAAATALVAAGCTAEKKDDAAPASGAPSIAAVAPGVTADTIKVGVVYPDLTAVKHVVKTDHGDYEATYDALIKKVNDAGGINGRKIEPVYGAINVASPAAAQETCVKLTQDEKVFAVIGSFNANEPLCYVQTNKTAVVGGPLTAKNYAQAQAPWFSDQRGGDEIGPGITLLKDALVGKKVAVVGVVNEQSLVDDIVVPALRGLGVTPVETAIMDANFRDAAAVAQQTGVFIQKFEASGADTVIVVGGMAAQFPTQLEKTDYRPRLLFTNNTTIGTYINDTAQHDYSTMANSLAIATNQQWTEPTLQQCVATVEAAIPDLKGKLTDPQALPAGTTPTPQVSVDSACHALTLFQAIAAKAGQELNYQTFQQAGFSLGAFQTPRNVDKANYTPTTPHGDIPPVLWKYDPATRKFVLA